MTVLPNSFERYTAALRILTSIFILKNNISQKYLRNLRKIYTAEAFYSHRHKQPLNIQKFASDLLYAVSVIKPQKFIFSVNCSGNFLINKNIFSVLLLELCKECNSIQIQFEENVIINFKGNYKKALPALKKLKGFYFYSVNTNCGKFIIPALKTNQDSVPFANEWENIAHQFSAVNLFFENVL